MKLKMLAAAAALVVLPVAAAQAAPKSIPQAAPAVVKKTAPKQSLALNPTVYRYCLRKYYAGCLAKYAPANSWVRRYCIRWAVRQCQSGVNG